MWAAEWRKENNLCNDTRILEVAKNNNNKKKMTGPHLTPDESVTSPK